MNTARSRRYDDDDYLLDDEMSVDYEAYEDEESKKEKVPASQYIKNFFRKFKSNDSEAEDEESYDDEAYEEDTQSRNASQMRSSNYHETGSRSRRYEKSFEEERANNAPRDNSREYKTLEYSEEDYNKYSKKFGVGASGSSSSQSKAKKQSSGRTSPVSGRPRRQTPSLSSTSSASWEKYRGTVNKIYEVQPTNMDNIAEIGEMLMQDNAVIMDLSRMGSDTEKAINFLDGVTFVIDYRFERISSSTYYICIPDGFLISYDFTPFAYKPKR